MNWKEFLKPDWRKITLSAIFYITLLLVVVPNVGWGPYIRCPNGYIEITDVFTSRVGCFREDLLFFYNLFLLFLVPVIWFYLLSCSIVWILNWKKFFKPNRKKIITFIIFMILGTVSIGFNTCFDGSLTCSTFPWYILHVILNFFFIIPISNLISIFIILFLIEPIYWYLLSCLLVWILDKFRKVKKK